MRTWELIRLALEALRRTPLRAILTTAGVAIACGSLIAMVAFALGLQRQAERPFTQLGLFNQIEVFPRRAEGTNVPALLNDAALARMEQIEGVTAAFPHLQISGLKVRYGDHETSAMAMALPRELGLVGVVQELVTAGEFFSTGIGAEALLSASLAEELGFSKVEDALGKKVALEASGLSPTDSTTFQFERRVFEVKVVGIYTLPAMGPGPFRQGVLLPVDLVRSIPGIQFQSALDQLRTGGTTEAAGYRQAVVRVEHPRDVPHVKTALEDSGFRTRALIDQFEEMRRFFVFLDLLLASVGTVALVVASLGVINTLLIAVLERKQEIGLCKAVGASEGDLRVLFMTEAAWVGAWGGIGGIVLGWTVASILDFAARVYTHQLGVPLEGSLFAFPVWLLLGTMGFAISVSVLAGVLPANRAAQVDPIRALRGL